MKKILILFICTALASCAGSPEQEVEESIDTNPIPSPQQEEQPNI